MPARRVRVVERDGPERRREFAQDVTADGAADETKVKSEESFFAAEA
jgi:hypothetical protein